MTKYLLGTTAVLGALFVSAPASAKMADSHATPTANVPALTISGQAAFNFWFSKNKVEHKKKVGGDNKDLQHYGEKPLATVDDARLKFSVDGKTEPGMGYGLVFTLEPDANKGTVVREAYLYLNGSWGTTYMGDADGVEKTMAFGGFDPLVGTGGFDGNFDRVVNMTTGAVTSTDLAGTTKRSTKITYISPEWRGLQAGISYTPKSDHRGSAELSTLTSADKESVFTRNNVAIGANFKHKFANGFDFALSGTAVFAKVRPPFEGVLGDAKFQNARSFAFGTLMSWKGVEFGFEYGNNGKFGLPKNVAGWPNAANAGQFIDFGLGYTWGCTKASVGYYYGWRKAATAATTTDTSKSNIFTAGIEHKLAPGLAMYFEYAHYNMKNPGAAFEGAARNAAFDTKTPIVGNNKANAFVLGTKIKF